MIVSCRDAMRSANLAILAALSLLACRGDAEEVRTIAAWADALHARDFARLAAFDGRAPQEGEAEFEAWVDRVERVFREYEEQRDRGRVNVDPDGYMIPLTTRMGRGTFWETTRLSRDGSLTAVELRLNFGYGDIAYGNLPRGTTVFVLTEPLGSVESIVLGRGRVHEMSVLEHLDLRVDLTRTGGEDRPQVTGMSWIDRSAVYRSVSWVF